MQPTSEIIKATEAFVQQYMLKYDASHDWTHIERVVRLAEHIASTEQQLHGTKYNATIVKLAALLHDVGDAKYAGPDDPSDPVRQFLISAGADEELASTVQSITDRVSFSKEKKDPEGVRLALARFPELAVVQDADRLDAIGAVGIGRCFTFGAFHAERQRSKAFSSSDVSMNSNSMMNAIEHFDDKLVLLEGMMKTQTGKRLAQKRTQRLKIFQSWWSEEHDSIIS